jgi:hypothetical protein
MKTPEQLVDMQKKLRVSMMSVQGSGAPARVIERSAVALASAVDVLNWVLEKPSELARIEEEYDRVVQEMNTANE